jgi:hypothetical protein
MNLVLKGHATFFCTFDLISTTISTTISPSFAQTERAQDKPYPDSDLTIARSSTLSETTPASHSSNTPSITMSQNSPSNSNSADAFPFNNKVNNWTALSIVGVVATVLGFIAIIIFVFWLFRRESRIRREDAQASSKQNLILHTQFGSEKVADQLY